MRYYNPQIADLISSIIIYTCGFSLFFKEVITRIFSRKQGNEISETLKNESDGKLENRNPVEESDKKSLQKEILKDENDIGKDIKNGKGEQAR